MTKSFANHLLSRPIDCRWIKAPLPVSGKPCACLLESIDGDMAKVVVDDKIRFTNYKPWRVPLVDVDYR